MLGYHKEVIKTLYIKDKITNDLTISEDSYLTFVGFLLMQKGEEFMYYVTTSLLSYLLTKIYPPNRFILHSLSNGIIDLANRQIIIMSQNDKEGEWIIDLSVINECGDKKEDNYYTSVKEKDIPIILSSNEKHYGRSISLLRFYIYVLSTLHKKKDNKQGLGFTSLNKMSLASGITKKTIISYFNKLEELELIYTYHAKNTVVFNNGNIREISSTYGRFENKEKIIQYGSEYEEKYGSEFESSFKKLSRNEMSKTKSYSQKYTYLVKCIAEGKPNPYDEQECKDIYKSMQSFNIKSNNPKSKKKDLTVFSKFKFYENN